MYILGIDTTGISCTCGLINMDTGKVSVKKVESEMSHLKYVADITEKLLAEEGLSLSPKGEIAAVACSVGPGSFTGIRIGVAFGRSVCDALNIPAISVPTLELYRNKLSKAAPKKPIAGIINARRGQVYGIIYDEKGDVVLKPGCHMLRELLKVSDEFPETVFYGDGVDAYMDILSEAPGRIIAPVEERYVDAGDVVMIGLEKFNKGETIDFEKLLPEYHRLAEAEQKLKDGSLAKEREAKMARFINNG